MKRDDLDVFGELSEIMSSVNSALNRLQVFQRKHPYLVAPNILRHWEENLRETSTLMTREFHALRNGKDNKTYDKRCVCNICHTVYMEPLPEDGICDGVCTAFTDTPFADGSDCVLTGYVDDGTQIVTEEVEFGYADMYAAGFESVVIVWGGVT